MFRIRKITEAYFAANNDALEQIFSIIRKQFSDIKESKIKEISQQLVDPLRFRFSSILLIVEDSKSNVRGFALLLYMSDKNFCFLDYIAVKPGRTSSGVGGSLYERVREEALMLESSGIFMECLPDDPTLCTNTEILEQNKSRLAFYERYGAFPITGTKYETPVKPGDDCPPYLVYDNLGNGTIPSKENAKAVIRAILERKYPEYCPESYVQMVLNSIEDDPVQLRAPRYKKKTINQEKFNQKNNGSIPLIINDKHDIHHVREIGYIESPIRVKSILNELDKTGIFTIYPIRKYPETLITKVHSSRYVGYFKKVCENLPEGKSVYPYVFPVRNSSRPPLDLSVLAGYYCIDTFTPLNKNAYLAARRGVNCALTGADLLLEGKNAVYALIRPPGHHAEKSVYGGFCYFNNAAIAANYLSKYGKVAILDIDYHHGNGQQQIFYHRKDVFTVSIHGHPSFAYPYFNGFADEKGENEGVNYNKNIPLKEIITNEEYTKALLQAIKAVQKFNPWFLIICLGFDTAKGDPTGTWSLAASDFRKNGELIGLLKYPTLLVQEGGYKNRSLGTNAKAFFEGFWKNKNKH